MGEPVRTCVGCRQVKGQQALVRLAVDAAGSLQVNPRRWYGRTAYVCPSPGCLSRALRKGTLARALRRELGGPELARLHHLVAEAASGCQDETRPLILRVSAAGGL